MLKLKRREDLLKYTNMFIVLIVIFIGLFIFYDKSLIWKSDGINQHFPILYDFNENIRKFFSDMSLGFKEWSFEIGYGSDIIGAYSYYILGDPISYLSLLFPLEKMELAYNILIIIRLYLSGISFIIYARYMGYSDDSVSLGAISYAFSGFVMMGGIKHPYFINPLIILPIAFLSIEFFIKNKSKCFFAVVVAISMIINFYFFYMIAIISFLYLILRLLQIKKSKKNFLKVLRSTTFYGIIGIMISSVILLPSIYSFLTSSRVIVKEANTLLALYPISYYINLFFNVISSGSYPFWTILTFPILTVLFLPVFFRVRNENKTYFYMLMIFTVMIFIPSAGSFMNGMSGISNRWTFAFVFISSIVITVGFENISKITKKDKIYMISILIFFSILAFIKYFFPEIKNEIKPQIIIGFIFLYIINYFKYSKEKLHTTVALLLLLNIGVIIVYKYSSYGNNFIKSFMNSKKADDYYLNGLNGADDFIKNFDKGFYRISKTDDVSRDKTRNNSIYSNFYGIDSFLSINNGYLAEFSKDLNNRAYTPNSPIINFDNRHIINSIMGVKYFISKNNNLDIDNRLTKLKTIGKSTIYENNDVMPFGFVYNKVISKEEFKSLNGIEKEESLIYSAAIDKSNSYQFSKHNSNIENIKYTIEKGSEKIKGNTIEIKEENEEIVLKIEEEFKGNIYLEIDGVEYTSDLNNKSLFEQYLLSIRRFNKGDGFSINSRFREVSKNFNIPDSLDISNNYRTKIMLTNLGIYNDINKDDRVIIKFNKKGIYKFDSIKIKNFNYYKYINDLNNLKANSLDIKTMSNDKIIGNLYSNSSGILMIQIPYSHGWKIKIDNKYVDTVKVNGAFLGCEVKEGNSEILLEYKTPFLRVGLFISVLGVTILIYLYKYSKKDN